MHLVFLNEKKMRKRKKGPKPLHFSQNVWGTNLQCSTEDIKQICNSGGTGTHLDSFFMFFSVLTSILSKKAKKVEFQVQRTQNESAIPMGFEFDPSWQLFSCLCPVLTSILPKKAIKVELYLCLKGSVELLGFLKIGFWRSDSCNKASFSLQIYFFSFKWMLVKNDWVDLQAISLWRAWV